MKKFSKVILAASLTLMSAMGASAQTVTADNVTGAQGETVELAINLNNGEVQITTMGLDLYLPEGVTVQEDSAGDPIIHPSSRKADHIFAAKIQSDGAYRFLVYSNNNRTISGTEGVIFTVPIELNSEPGTYEIQLKNIEVVDPDFAQINPANTTATLTITEPVVKQKDVITWDIDLSDYSFEDEYLLSATCASGLTVSYSLDILEGNTTPGEEAAELSVKRGKTYLVVYEDCLIDLTASTEGDEDYTAASETYQIRFANGKCTECSILGTIAVELVDGTPYTNDADKECDTITYTRTFTSTAWQALYLPFDMEYADWSALGDVAVLDDASNDGENATVTFKTVHSGTLAANTPCIFKPNATGEMKLSVSDATLKAAPAVDASVSRPVADPFITVYGNYEVKTGLAALGAFALTADGQFVKAASASQTLNPYRNYLLIDSSKKAPARISVNVDGEAAGIEDIIIMQQADGRYYDLLGRPAENPQHGIYIRGGEKVIIK